MKMISLSVDVRRSKTPLLKLPISYVRDFSIFLSEFFRSDEKQGKNCHEIYIHVIHRCLIFCLLLMAMFQKSTYGQSECTARSHALC